MKRNQPNAGQLAKTPSQSISLNDSMAVLCYYHSESNMRKQGGDCPNLEMFGTQSSPCSFHKVQI